MHLKDWVDKVSLVSSTKGLLAVGVGFDFAKAYNVPKSGKSVVVARTLQPKKNPLGRT
jgi:microsomal dipeptidase-like Zn-dependent dipeptidase